MVSTSFSMTKLSVFLALSVVSLNAQDNPSSSKLPFRTALLLTPEFCASRIAHGAKDNPKIGIEVGKDACAEIEPALKDIFADLTTIHESKDAGNAQLVLTPKFVDVAVNTGITAFSNQELTLFLEWNATDAYGRTIWLDTVQGAAKHHQGNLFTARRNARIVIHDAVQDVATESARKMSSSVELRKYAP